MKLSRYTYICARDVTHDFRERMAHAASAHHIVATSFVVLFGARFSAMSYRWWGG